MVWAEPPWSHALVRPSGHEVLWNRQGSLSAPSRTPTRHRQKIGVLGQGRNVAQRRGLLSGLGADEGSWSGPGIQQSP